MSDNPVAGWYPDQALGSTKLRYWDGAEWTDQYTEAPDRIKGEVSYVASSYPQTPQTFIHEQAPEQTTLKQTFEQNKKAVYAFACGLLSFFVSIFLMAGIGIVVGIAAIVFGIPANKLPTGRGFARAGIALGCVNLVLVFGTWAWTLMQ